MKEPTTKEEKRKKNSCQWQLLSLCGTGSESAFTLLRFTKSTKACMFNSHYETIDWPSNVYSND